MWQNIWFMHYLFSCLDMETNILGPCAPFFSCKLTKYKGVCNKVCLCTAVPTRFDTSLLFFPFVGSLFLPRGDFSGSFHKCNKLTIQKNYIMRKTDHEGNLSNACRYLTNSLFYGYSHDELFIRTMLFVDKVNSTVELTSSAIRKESYRLIAYSLYPRLYI